MITRYGFDDGVMDLHLDGDYVLYSDHVSEVQRYREALERIVKWYECEESGYYALRTAEEALAPKEEQDEGR